MAAELKQALPGQVKDVKLIPSSGGVFEIRRGNDVVFSKRKLGRFSEDGEVKRLLAS